MASSEDIQEVAKTLSGSGDVKSIFLSKVFWGVVLAVVARYVHITDVPAVANDLATIAGAALAIYGRFKATKSVTLTTPKSLPAPEDGTTKL